jgi:hypothetical protein
MPTSQNTPRVVACNSQTAGQAAWLKADMNGATRQAIRSGCRSASCFGSNSPNTIERNVTAATTRPKPKGSAITWLKPRP